MKKLFILILMILFSLNAVNALYINGTTTTYWDMDDLINQINPAESILTNIGAATAISGCKYDDCYQFDGSNDYMTTPITVNTVFSHSIWFKNDVASARKAQFAIQSGTDLYYVETQNNGNLAVFLQSSTGNNIYDVSLPLSSTSWTHLVVTTDGTTLKTYINGVDTVGSRVVNGALSRSTINTTAVVGAREDTTSQRYDGDIDETAFWNIQLSQGEITDLFNNGLNESPIANKSLTIDIMSLTDNTFTNSDTLNVALNITNTTTNGLINTTLFISNGSSYVIGTNTQNVSYTLNDIQEGTINLWTFSENNETNVTSSNFTYTFDYTSPTIDDNILSEYNNYTISGFNSSCSDTNLLLCEITINSQTVDLNTSSFTFSTNGNQSYNITATDKAGNNLNASGIVLVNPKYALYFTLANGTTISDFTLDSKSFEVYGNGTYYNDDIAQIGSNTLLFEKLGFASTNISFTLNTTNEINLTFNITESKIIINIFDRETELLITGLSTLTLVATTGFNTTTTTGQVNISNINFINELYQLIVSHDNYSTESVFFTYDNQINLNVNVYLLNATATDIGDITIQALSDSGFRVSGAICDALEWKPSLSAYQSVAQGLTNINGETLLNIEIGTKLYKFSCAKDGNTAFSIPGIISTTGTTLPIILLTTILQPSNLLGGFNYEFTNTTFNSTYDRLTYTFNDNNNLVTEACIKSYSVAGTNKNLLSSDCLSSSTGEIQTLILFNNTFKVVAEASVVIDGQTILIDDITYESTTSLTEALKEYHLDVILPLFFILLGIVFGLVIKPQIIYISEIAVIIMVWFSVLVVPTTISASIALFVTLIAGLMLLGGKNK